MCNVQVQYWRKDFKEVFYEYDSETTLSLKQYYCHSKI